jgi:GntR family transcriptional regulator
MQIVHQVEHALRLGYLKQGDQLPRIKDVVGSLLINPNTVQKAYRDLEQKGIARGRPGQGTFIEVAPETLSLAQFTQLRQSLLDGWLKDAADAGLDDEGITALFISAQRETAERRAAQGTANPTRGDDVVA